MGALEWCHVVERIDLKKQLFGLIAIGMIAIMVLGACSSGGEATAEVETPVVQESPAVQESPTVQDTPVVQESPVVEASPVFEETPAEGMTDAEMEALITEKIHDKHTLDFILSQNKTAEEWSTTIDRMIKYGAQINEEEKALIIEWLVNRK